MLLRSLFALAAAALTAPACAQEAPPRAAAPEANAARPPPPAFEPDMPVIDRGGAVIGRFRSLAEGEAGPMAVVEIDGKLVSVPQQSLTLEGERIRSAQSKADILASAKAPR